MDDEDDGDNKKKLRSQAIDDEIGIAPNRNMSVPVPIPARVPDPTDRVSDIE